MKVSHDKKHDLLALHAGFREGESFATNIVAGDLVLDVSTKGRVCGVEILNLTRFLERFTEHAERIADNLTDASFTAEQQDSGVFLTLTFRTDNESLPARLAVPIEAAASA